MIIIGDIHGCKDTLDALLDQIPEEEKAKGVVSVGDLVDRGPKSREVIQFFIDNADKGFQVVMGNHEDLMIAEGLQEASFYLKNNVFNYGTSNAYGSPSNTGVWAGNGGFDTLSNYLEYPNPDALRPVLNMEVLVEHIEWMKKLPLYLEFKEVKNDKEEHLLVTHSSANKVWSWSEERRESNSLEFRNHLMWGRPNTIRPISGIYNVFGHTPVELGPKIKEPFANIDTGACFTQDWALDVGYGVMTALQFPEMKVYKQKNVEKKEEYESAFGKIEE